MIRMIGGFFKKLDAIGSKFLYIWDEWDLTTLIGYGPWFILGIWMVFESREDMPLLLAIFFVMIFISICGEITSFLVLGLKIVFMGILIPIQKIAKWYDDYEERTTGIGRYIEISRNADGDSIWHAKYLHD